MELQPSKKTLRLLGIISISLALWMLYATWKNMREIAAPHIVQLTMQFIQDGHYHKLRDIEFVGNVVKESVYDRRYKAAPEKVLPPFLRKGRIASYTFEEADKPWPTKYHHKVYRVTVTSPEGEQNAFWLTMLSEKTYGWLLWLQGGVKAPKEWDELFVL